MGETRWDSELFLSLVRAGVPQNQAYWIAAIPHVRSLSDYDLTLLATLPTDASGSVIATTIEGTGIQPGISLNDVAEILRQDQVGRPPGENIAGVIVREDILVTDALATLRTLEARDRTGLEDQQLQILKAEIADLRDTVGLGLGVELTDDFKPTTALNNLRLSPRDQQPRFARQQPEEFGQPLAERIEGQRQQAFLDVTSRNAAEQQKVWAEQERIRLGRGQLPAWKYAELREEGRLTGTPAGAAEVSFPIFQENRPLVSNPNLQRTIDDSYDLVKRAFEASPEQDSAKFVREFDFEGTHGRKSPYERGERPGRLAPKLRRL